MKLDLFKLNNYGSIDIDEDITFEKSIYEGMNIRDIRNCHIRGNIEINYLDELEANIIVTGTFILPCAVSLEDVEYPFSTEIVENIGKFEEFYNKNKNLLDILPFIWENIVSEVPIRVIKDGVEVKTTSGDGWELVSED